MGNEFSIRKNKMRIALSVLLTAILLVCLLCLAWFYNNRNIYTFAHVESPSTLAIKGYNQTTVEQISLSTVDLTNDSHQASFVFCITGSNIEKYDLELAYTTNVPFTYTIRPTTQVTDRPGSGDFLTYTSDDGTSYYYGTGEEELSQGKYVNKNSEGIAETSGENDRHTAAYDAYDRNYVQKNAEPVYYLFEKNAVRDLNQSNFVDYYILELTWNADIATSHQKETDLVYLLAANSTP